MLNTNVARVALAVSPAPRALPVRMTRQQGEVDVISESFDWEGERCVRVRGRGRIQGIEWIEAVDNFLW